MFGDPVINPKGWPKKKMGDVLIIERGGSPRPIEDYITTEDDGINWIKIGDTSEDTIYIDSVKERIKPEGLKKTRQVFPGDLILSNSMSFGKPYILNISGCIHDGWLLLRDTNNIFNKVFLCTTLGFPSILSSFKGMARGGVVNNLNKNLVGSLEIIVPPKEIQDKFVKFLEQTNKSKAICKVIFQSFDNLVKSRFIEMFGDPISNPYGWSKKKMKDLLTIERGGSPRPIDSFITDDENGLNWIKIGDAVEGTYYINSVKEKIKPEGLKKTRQVYPGDLILSNSMSFGKPYILNISGCIHDGWLVLHDSNDVFNKLFLCFTLGCPSITDSFKSMARGGVVNNLNKDLVGNLDIIVPPRKHQDDFVNFLEEVDKSKFIKNRYTVCNPMTGFNFLIDGYFKFYIL